MMTKRIDSAGIASIIGTLYPPQFDKRCRARERKRLGHTIRGCATSRTRRMSL